MRRSSRQLPFLEALCHLDEIVLPPDVGGETESALRKGRLEIIIKPYNAKRFA